MNKIKIAGIIIFLVSITLAFVSTTISEHTKSNNNFLETINKQKAFTQEISKNIFYIYKNKHSSTTQLDSSIKEFLNIMNSKEERLKTISSTIIKAQSNNILLLWNKFYLNVQKFRDQNKVTTAYSGIVVEKTVNEIYSLNLELIVKFDKLISLHKDEFHQMHKLHKYIQYGLFLILLIVLIYFLRYISKSSNNFDKLMKRIDDSIKSIDQIENKADGILDDVTYTKEEDTIIEALDELMLSSKKLKKLKIDLENLNNLKSNN